MTDNGNTQGGVSQNLTETPLCPRQILEGNYPGLSDAQYHRLLDYQHRDLLRYRFKQWSTPALTNDEEDDFYDIIMTSIRFLEERLANRPKKHSHAGHELGAREFTLTYSPKWMTDSEARIQMEKALDKLCKYYKDEIVELRAVGEIGSNGLSHVHCFYKLQGGLKITDKNFKRAWKWWNPRKKLGQGFEGGHHASVKEESDFRGYMDKDIDTAWLEKNVGK